MNNKKVCCIILGLGDLGFTVAKETARYMSCMKNNSATDFSMVLCDYGAVGSQDIGNNYLPEDFGWSKSAVVRELLISNLNREEDSYNGKFLNLKNKVASVSFNLEKHFSDFVEYIEETKNRTDLYFICNCTNNTKVYNLCKQLMENKVYMENIVLFQPDDTDLTVYTKMLSSLIGKMPEETDQYDYTHVDCMHTAYAMVEKMVSYVSDRNLKLDVYEKMDYSADLSVKKRPELIICVGAGGTGGDFVKEFLPYMAQHTTDLSFLLIDGDRVEEKNCERQPFSKEDVFLKKTDALCKSLTHEFPQLTGRVFSWPYYLESIEDLDDAVSFAGFGADTAVVLVGAVDNHRARQVLHSFYQERDDVIYVDSGNEFDYGEVVTGCKEDGMEKSKPRAHYFPDVLTDNSPSAAEQSCGAVNVSMPQHQITNLIAAEILFKNMHSLLEKQKICSGIVYFDVFSETYVHTAHKEEFYDEH